MQATRYKKPAAVKQLEALAMEAVKERYPGLPYPAPRLYRDDTANNLTKCICDFIRLLGGSAFRINSQGQYDPRLKKWRPSGQRKGLPDIQATMNGQAIYVEVKIGRDKLSEHQKQIRDELTASGALYFVARNFTEFLEWFDINKKTRQVNKT